ncbi:S-adenosyl-L-methionine-dependent methyltransferase [Aspergillus desertorum]
MSSNPSESVFSTVASKIASLGFAPLAIRFNIFNILAELDGAATGRDIRDAYLQGLDKDSIEVPPAQLVEDTLVAMTALSWVDLAGDSLYRVNAITNYLAKTPSAIHGILHFTTEVLLGSAFLMRKLESTGFEYPFAPLQTPFQYAYHLMEKEELAKLHTYAIMAAEKRMSSFHTFMQGMFGIGIPRVSERLLSLGYNLSVVVEEAGRQGLPTTMVDIGGGRGNLLLDIKASIPSLDDKDLILQELEPEPTDIRGLTVMKWDYAEKDSSQPIQRALIYHLSGILHNLPDSDAEQLLQKICDAMASYSRILIHERLKDSVPLGNATMIVLYGGRERNAAEWKALAEKAGLRVTYLRWPNGRYQGVVEMRKL